MAGVVKATTYNLWKATPLPVLAFLCDLQSERVYWTQTLSNAPKPGSATLLLRFDESNVLPATFPALTALIDMWFRAFRENLSRDIPAFYKIFEELEQQRGSDAWMPMDPESERDCRLFYRHLLQLRMELGLPCDLLPHLDDWYVRSAATWKDSQSLFNGTFEELLAFVTPLYKEAIASLRNRTRGAPITLDTQDLLNFFRRLEGDSVPVTIADPRVCDRSYLARLESTLRDAKCLKHSVSQDPTG